MTAFRRHLILTASLALAGACTFEPRYPTREGVAPGPGVAQVKPRYPTRLEPPSGPQAYPAPAGPAPAPAYRAPAPAAAVPPAPASRAQDGDIVMQPLNAPAQPGPQHMLYSLDGDQPLLIRAAVRHAKAADADEDTPPKKKTKATAKSRRHAKTSRDEDAPKTTRHGRHHAKADTTIRHRRAGADEEASVSRHGKDSHASRTAAREPAADEASASSGAGDLPSVVVRKGETWASLAARTHTPAVVLAVANGLDTDVRAKAGKTLRVPRVKLYTVGRGDTLTGIAERFGVSQAKIAELNGMSRGEHLQRGDKVALPAQASDSGAQAGASGPAPRWTVAPPPPKKPPARRPPVETARRPTPSRPIEPSDLLGTGAAAVAGGAAGAAAAGGAPAPNGGTYQRPPAGYEPPATPPASPRLQPTAPQPYGQGQTAPTPTAPTQTAPAQGAPSRPAYTPPSRPAYTPPAYAPAPSASEPPMASAPTRSEQEIAASARGRFVAPLRGQLVQRYGPSGPGQRNDGWDIAANPGDPVRAAAAGQVVYAGSSIPGYGNMVLVKHPGGWVSAYAYLSRIEVRINDQVSSGQEIGQVGQSGNATRPELHFELRYAADPRDKARPIDPALVLGEP